MARGGGHTALPFLRVRSRQGSISNATLEQAAEARASNDKYKAEPKNL
jgi:hypothetical protein